MLFYVGTTLKKGKDGTEHERRRHVLGIVSREVSRHSTSNYRRFIPVLHSHQHGLFGRLHRAFRFLRRRASDYRLVPSYRQTVRIGLFSSLHHYGAVCD